MFELYRKVDIFLVTVFFDNFNFDLFPANMQNYLYKINAKRKLNTDDTFNYRIYNSIVQLNQTKLLIQPGDIQTRVNSFRTTELTYIRPHGENEKRTPPTRMLHYEYIIYTYHGKYIYIMSIEPR